MRAVSRLPNLTAAVLPAERQVMTLGRSMKAWSAEDCRYMERALELAEHGRYTAMPNPCVGCVIVRDDQVVASAWHHAAGEAHAEILALRKAGEAARGATLYVTLEPCCHTGRTPPCVPEILRSGVRRVVVAARDPNPKVAGMGAEQLRARRIEVDQGLLEERAAWQNRGFFTRMKTGRPLVRIKLAGSLDGRTALASGESAWISNAASRRDVQLWRARSGALITTADTVAADDPRLDVRLDVAPGDAVAAQPLRVVLDARLRTDPEAAIYSSGRTAVASLARASAKRMDAFARRGIELWRFNEKENMLSEVLERLAAMEVNEVQVEAGARLCGAMTERSLYDELLLYVAPCLLGDKSRPLMVLDSPARMDQRLNLDIREVLEIDGNIRVLLTPRADK